MIETNMGKLDRRLRGFLGASLVVVAFAVPAVSDRLILSLLVGGFGALNVISSSLGVCPVYTLAGMDTMGRRRDDSNGGA
jgi:hypothetical protein